MLDITTTTDSAGTTVTLAGRIDAVTSKELENTLIDLYDTTDLLAVDMAGIEYISSAGLRALLSATKTMKEKGGSFVIRNPSDNVTDVLEITNLNVLLSIE